MCLGYWGRARCRVLSAPSVALGVAGGIRSWGGGGQLLAVACFSIGAQTCPLGVTSRSQGRALPSLPVPPLWSHVLGPPWGCSVMNFQGWPRAAPGGKPGLARALSPLRRSSQAGGKARPRLRASGLCYSDMPFSSDGNGESGTLILATCTERG